MGSKGRVMNFFRKCLIVAVGLAVGVACGSEAAEVRQEILPWGTPLTKQIENDSFVIDRKYKSSSFSDLMKMTLFILQLIYLLFLKSQRKQESLSNEFIGIAFLKPDLTAPLAVF